MELSIGDFVKHKDNGRFFKITQENITLLSKGTCFEKWRPQKNEWRRFYNYNGLLTICKFIQMTNNKYLADSPNGKLSLSVQVFKHCEPFIGELPSFIKG